MKVVKVRFGVWCCVGEEVEYDKVVVCVYGFLGVREGEVVWVFCGENNSLLGCVVDGVYVFVDMIVWVVGVFGFGVVG